MLHFERWKIWSIVAVCLFGLLSTLPNLMSPDTLAKWPLMKNKINLGLDLRGGSYLLLEADVDQLKKKWFESIVNDSRKSLREAKILYTGLSQSADGVRFRVSKPEESGKALELAKTKLQRPVSVLLGGSGAADLDIKAEDNGNLIVITPTAEALNERIGNAMGAAQEVVRRRIDSLGTTEPSIQRQGLSRMVVQVPGFDDPTKLKILIGQTAAMSFHAVDESISPDAAESSGVPSGSKIFVTDEKERERNPSLPVKYVLKTVPEVEGGDLIDARPEFDNGSPAVSFRFNTNGAIKFGNYTAENVGHPFAIVLDDKVITAPNIRSAIRGGAGIITGNFTTEEATNLAIQLRSGALPTSLTVIDQRTVGPGLGADSIRAGTIAAIVGAIAVAAFMMFAYGLFGFFSVLALCVNVILLFGCMSLLGQTLTLPGIAGIVLTMGMAVDSNVLIYERIREELRSGKSAIAAIEQGFQRALVTVIDSHITTLTAGLIMFALGEGPIRGFAITLSIGIAISVFTAYTVTRLFVSLWVARQRQQTRNIVVPV
jgi:protein-export membrane protein SecD